MNASGDSNRSVRFTKTRIKSAFLKLLGKKQLHKITVAEIVKEADISRATFYLHYADIYDLLEKTENEFISEVLNEIMKFDEHTYTPGEYPVAKKVFSVFTNHSEQINLLLGENGDPAFSEKFSTALTDYFEKLLYPLITNKKMLRPVLSFLIGGVLNMFIVNLNEKTPVSSDELALISNRYLRATNKLLGLPSPEND